MRGASMGRHRLNEEDERLAIREFGGALDDVNIDPPGVMSRWAKGSSGNPAGRPKEPDDATLTEWLVHTLGKHGAKDLAVELISLAKTPGSSPTKLAAIQYIYNRIEGMPRQSVASSRPEEHPLVTIFRRITDDTKALEGHVIASLPDYSSVESAYGEGDSEGAEP